MLTLFPLPLQINPSTLFCTMLRHWLVFLVDCDWSVSNPIKRLKKKRTEYLFPFPTLKLCPALMSLFPCRDPSPHSYLLITSHSICFLYQLVATAPSLLALVPESSLMVPLYIAHNFVISLFVSKVLS